MTKKDMGLSPIRLFARPMATPGSKPTETIFPFADFRLHLQKMKETAEAYLGQQSARRSLPFLLIFNDAAEAAKEPAKRGPRGLAHHQ